MAGTAFVGKDHAVSVKAGHTYALAITTGISSTVAGTALLGGTASVRFDNVSLSVQTAGGGGNGSGSGTGGGLTTVPHPGRRHLPDHPAGNAQ